MTTENNLLPTINAIPNIGELAAYVPAPPPSAGEFLPYIHMHWPVQGPGKPYHLQLTDGGKANAQWLETPFILSVVFARNSAKIPNLEKPEDTEWAYEAMPGLVTATDARYKQMASGSIPNVEKGTSYTLALWRQGESKPKIVTFDAFKTLNNATFYRLADSRANKKKGLAFSTGDLQPVMKQSSKTNRWYPDAGLFSSVTRLTDLTDADLASIKEALAENESKVCNWLAR